MCVSFELAGLLPGDAFQPVRVTAGCQLGRCDARVVPGGRVTGSRRLDPAAHRKMKTFTSASNRRVGKAKRAWLILPGCLALILAMSGCAQRVAAAVQKTATASVPADAESAEPIGAVQADTATPEPVRLNEGNAQALAKMTFEAKETEPSMVWRPPLYDVPLALNPNDHFYLTSPLPFDFEDTPVQDYRYGYVLPDTTTLHTGTDIKAPLHTPILAAGDGKVVFAGYGLLNGNNDKKDPYGLAVVIRHNLSFQNRTILTVYAHMEMTTVQKGDWVKAGDQIGNVG
ncbi:M23 family metallopeptidase, partial [bacterium]|nr:M23 family metallopeptidase [bacterium]